MKVLVAYINIGSLPQKRGIEHAKKMGKRIKKNLPKKFSVIVIPVRDSFTRIERIP